MLFGSEPARHAERTFVGVSRSDASGESLLTKEFAIELLELRACRIAEFRLFQGTCHVVPGPSLLKTGNESQLGRSLGRARDTSHASGGLRDLLHARPEFAGQTVGCLERIDNRVNPVRSMRGQRLEISSDEIGTLDLTASEQAEGADRGEDGEATSQAL